MSRQRRVGVATVYKGYNYGSTLQAYATQEFISDLGYPAEILSLKGSLLRSRNVNICKLLVMFGRSAIHPALLTHTLRVYTSALKQSITESTRKLFAEFWADYLEVTPRSWDELKAYAANSGTLACVCGSDQIWNASHAYLDPLYYLRFAPEYKRVSFASSMGSDAVPQYNYGAIRRRLSDIPYLSVRETHAVRLIHDMTGREPTVLLDPTLLLDESTWERKLACGALPIESEPYALVYFLDSPSEAALECIASLHSQGLRCVTVLHQCLQQGPAQLHYVDAGPREFLHLLRNARFVCTDSFHGTAFALNFGVPFLVFERQYGSATNQSSRIESLLDIVGLEDHFIDHGFSAEAMHSYDSSAVQARLAEGRAGARGFLEHAFFCIERGCE